jgi:CubicO group peptidase (beta-lactamase class C family)
VLNGEATMHRKRQFVIIFVVILNTISTFFFTTLSNQQYLNGCVLIADKGKILYRNAFGYSDFIAKTKVTTNSMFDLASISKQFTAIGIMILREQGLLEYSSNIRTFFPQLPYDSITIRNLLNHTSGLVDKDDLINRYWDRTKIITNDDFLNLLREHQPPLAFRPGAEYQYSNTGYLLLAVIIEKVSGLTYGEFLRSNVFAPTGMKRTMNYRRRYMPEVINDYALGYVLSLEHDGYALPDSVERDKRVIYSDGLQGDGTISSTVEDLFRWDRCLYTSGAFIRFWLAHSQFR